MTEKRKTYRGLDALEQFRKEMFGDSYVDVKEAAKQYEEAKEKEIFETSVNGAIKQNKINNRVFCSMFEKEDAIQYENIFKTFKDNPSNKMYLQTLESDLKYANQRMIKENKCPIEIMLYASRVVNSCFSANAKMYDYLAKEISNILSSSDFMFKFSKDVIDHIITNWNWPNQIGATILGCGFYGRDRDLIESVIKKASVKTEANYSYSICKMLVASSDSYFAETLLSYCKQLENTPNDNKIRKLILDDGGFEKIGGDPKLIEEISSKGGISGFSRKMFNKLLTKYQNKGFDVNVGKTDTQLDELIQIIKNSVGSEKEEALTELYDEYFLSNEAKRITTALHRIRTEKIVEFGPYLEKFLSKDRTCGANSICPVYFDYQRMVSDVTELFAFLDNQGKKFQDDIIAINITKYLKIRSDDEREDYAYNALYQYLLSNNPTAMENASIKTVLKFDVPFIKYLKYSVSDILCDEKTKPFELNNALRNYLSLLNEDVTSLKRTLEQNDEIINTFVDLSNNSFNGQSDATISLIIKVVSYYKNTDKTSNILMNIYESHDFSERLKDEARTILISHGIVEPSTNGN